jgi:PAS domain S-box-containing protein
MEDYEEDRTMTDKSAAINVSRDAFNEFLENAVAQCDTAVYMISAEGEFLYVNNAVCLHTGYSREELLTMGVPDLDPWYDSTEWPHHWKEIMEGGTQVFESRHKRKDGTTIPVQIKALPIEIDGKKCMCSFSLDISNLVQTKSMLTELREEFDVIFQASNDWIFIIDDKGMILRATKNACDSLGLDEVDVLGHIISEFMAEESQEHFNSMFPAILKDDEAMCDIKFRHSDGSLLTFGCYPRVIIDEFDTITSVVILQRH